MCPGPSSAHSRHHRPSLGLDVSAWDMSRSPFPLAEASAAPKGWKLRLRAISLSEVMAILAPHAALGEGPQPLRTGAASSPCLSLRQLSSLGDTCGSPSPCNTESSSVRHALWPDGPSQVLGPQGPGRAPSSPLTALGRGPPGTLGASCPFQTLRASETDVLGPGRGRPMQGN